MIGDKKVLFSGMQATGTLTLGKSIRKTVILLMDFYPLKAIYLKMFFFPGVRNPPNLQLHSNRTSDLKKSFGP